MSSPLASLERVLRIAVAVLALAVAVLLNVRAHAAEHWTRVAEVTDVAITVETVSTLRLARLQGATDYHSMIDKGSREARHGYAVLSRNRVTGAYSCVIYVVRADASTLEHETRHCHGWVHR
jgi:hypothetical protein